MGFDHVKLEKGMYRESGKTFTQVLESLDPSENYKGTALEGTDAFQRQLKRFDIHAKGAYSDPVEKFFRTMDSSVLFPEYIARAVKQGMEENNVLPKITASTTTIDAMDYRSVYSVPSEQDKMLMQVSEGASIPATQVKTKANLVKLNKRGRMLVASYEAIRFQKLDLFSVTLRQIGAYIQTMHLKDAVEVLVKGDGNNEYTVKASYTCKQTSDEFCTVHFGDWSQAYAYDSYVYLPNTVAGTKYALYSDKECTKLLTVLDGVDFYAPKTSNIYVKAYDTEATVSIAVTGSFAEKDVEAGKNYANFNCKFYLPDGTDAIEWGVEVLSPDGTRTAKVKAEKLSERNEYTVRFGTEIGSKVTSIKGRAYLEYVKDGVKTTIYSSDEYVTVNLNA